MAISNDPQLWKIFSSVVDSTLHQHALNILHEIQEREWRQARENAFAYATQGLPPVYEWEQNTMKARIDVMFDYSMDNGLAGRVVSDDVADIRKVERHRSRKTSDETQLFAERFKIWGKSFDKVNPSQHGGFAFAGNAWIGYELASLTAVSLEAHAPLLYQPYQHIPTLTEVGVEFSISKPVNVLSICIGYTRFACIVVNMDALSSQLTCNRSAGSRLVHVPVPFPFMSVQSQAVSYPTVTFSVNVEQGLGVFALGVDNMQAKRVLTYLGQQYHDEDDLSADNVYNALALDIDANRKLGYVTFDGIQGVREELPVSQAIEASSTVNHPVRSSNMSFKLKGIRSLNGFGTLPELPSGYVWIEDGAGGTLYVAKQDGTTLTLPYDFFDIPQMIEEASNDRGSMRWTLGQIQLAQNLFKHLEKRYSAMVYNCQVLRGQDVVVPDDDDDLDF